MDPRYKTITFAEFQPHLDNPDSGWAVVWAALDSDDDGIIQSAVVLEMVCPFRLLDGKINLLRIPFDTLEQLEAIKDYVRAHKQVWANTLQGYLDEHFDPETIGKES